MSARPSILQQITAWNAEIAVRRKELEKEVRARRLSQSQADYVIISLEAVGDTLRRVERQGRMINQRLFNGDEPPVGGCW